MKKRRNVLISSSVLHKIRLSAVRAEQVRQGIFDGRYRTKKIPSKKVYNRSKIKRKKL
jgi:hypothetical protein